MPIKRINYGRGHGYVDTDLGEKVPSVTAILGDGLAKPGLINWAANATADAAVDRWEELSQLTPSKRLNELKRARYADRDAAANRGREVHTLAERIVRGEEVDVPDALAGHVESYVRFVDDFRVQPVLVEAVVVNRTHRYAGTLDLVADLADGQRWLLDVKTARSGVFPENALQIAAYRHATHYLDMTVSPAVERDMLPVDGCGVIHVRHDGYSLVPVDTGPHILRTFLYVRELWRWANETSTTVA